MLRRHRSHGGTLLSLGHGFRRPFWFRLDLGFPKLLELTKCPERHIAGQGIFG
jgi:hypothetical protein